MNQHLYIRNSNSIVTWIQKNACTAVNVAVSMANGFIDKPEQFNWGIVGDKNQATEKQIINADYRFVILRDPLQRLASAYFDQVATGKNPYQKIIEIEQINNLNFSSFIEFLDRNDAIRLDKHWQPQSDFLLQDYEYDDYFNVDDLETANHILQSKIGFKIHDIRGIYNYGMAKYTPVYSDEIYEKVAKLYAVDYLLFKSVIGV